MTYAGCCLQTEMLAGHVADTPFFPPKECVCGHLPPLCVCLGRGTTCPGYPPPPSPRVLTASHPAPLTCTPAAARPSPHSLPKSALYLLPWRNAHVHKTEASIQHSPALLFLHLLVPKPGKVTQGLMVTLTPRAGVHVRVRHRILTPVGHSVLTPTRTAFHVWWRRGRRNLGGCCSRPLNTHKHTKLEYGWITEQTLCHT